jgi:hypothetical protein
MIRRVPNVALLLSAVALLLADVRALAGTSIKTQTLAAAGETPPPGDLQSASRNRSAVTLGDDSGKPSRRGIPPSHTVQKGDTLWDICDEYFENPWQWPRVWSYNPEIVNPHWIYPGEVVRLRREGSITSAGGPQGGATGNGGTTPGMSLRPKTVAPGTVFLRNQGYVYDPATEDTGEIIGSPEDRMLLTAPGRAYARVTKDQADKLEVGATLSIFQYTRPVKRGNEEVGKIVQILGTLRVDTIDRKTYLVEGTITESTDVIERGARLGPIERRIDVVPPKTNEAELRGTILSSVQPNVMYGQNQVVFIDKGEDDGLKVGNRLFVVRKGDPWKKGLSSTGEISTNKVELGEGPAVVRPKEIPPDSDDLPDEVVAEMRITRVRKKTATCLVTSSTLDLQGGDVWVAKKGY